MKIKRILSLRMSGEDVSYLQNRLKELGFFNDKIKIARGEYRGFIIDGDRYRNIKVSRRSAGVFISVKELGCQKAPLDENGMIQCNDVKYKFEVEFSKNEAASGTLIEQGNGIKREWKIEKKSH